jgi:hypothetical protein
MALDPQHVQAVFLAAAACTDSSQRAVLVNGQCGGDAELRDHVLVLLKAHDQPDALPRPRLVSSLRGVGCAEYAAEAVIAQRDRLQAEIAQGGMGSVWLAEQNERFAYRSVDRTLWSSRV